MCDHVTPPLNHFLLRPDIHLCYITFDYDFLVSGRTYVNTSQTLCFVIILF